MGDLGTWFHFPSAGASKPPDVPTGEGPGDTLTLTGVIIIVLYPRLATPVATE